MTRVFPELVLGDCKCIGFLELVIPRHVPCPVYLLFMPFKYLIVWFRCRTNFLAKLWTFHFFLFLPFSEGDQEKIKPPFDATFYKLHSRNFLDQTFLFFRGERFMWSSYLMYMTFSNIINKNRSRTLLMKEFKMNISSLCLFKTNDFKLAWLLRVDVIESNHLKGDEEDFDNVLNTAILIQL